MNNFKPPKTCVPEKVGVLTPLGVKSGQCNGTPKKWGSKVVLFLATFTLLLNYLVYIIIAYIL